MCLSATSVQSQPLALSVLFHRSWIPSVRKNSYDKLVSKYVHLLWKFSSCFTIFRSKITWNHGTVWKAEKFSLTWKNINHFPTKITGNQTTLLLTYSVEIVFSTQNLREINVGESSLKVCAVWKTQCGNYRNLLSHHLAEIPSKQRFYLRKY